MEILESVMYIAIGFVPMLLAMEAGWKLGKKSILKTKGEVAPEIGIR